ncbi:retron Ec78 anti-phage system effector HNH endonuclease PtuB [Acinetobacter baumannii]|uniref:retron Ec78 anti-phage system effector HNH endonuclease PtuB n=1 Tax=Acinetobacter baumannii TaxID=470 RepID=UPI0029587D85|nr:retron Ec78 anti-phage system effector HNH endonuclease PtuB [Acinetobacter baumannii]WNX60304.1 retron Ec78 anti-phage system effector HNH endonuclease PtuB [Acinetobacter baumannii]
MRKLTRLTAPTCLRQLQSISPTKWQLEDSHRSEIWQYLNEMQNNFCAYCESRLLNNACHIEHLIPQEELKKQRGRSIYEWNNLYGSCDNSEHCGRYKDHIVKDYDPENLIKPDSEDSSYYFSFLENGHVIAKSNLAESSENIKAEETIRVLNLDCPRLMNLRAKKIGQFQMEYLVLGELVESSDMNNVDDIEFLKNELEAFNARICCDEYFIAVKQNTIG